MERERARLATRARAGTLEFTPAAPAPAAAAVAVEAKPRGSGAGGSGTGKRKGKKLAVSTLDEEKESDADADGGRGGKVGGGGGGGGGGKKRRGVTKAQNTPAATTTTTTTTITMTTTMRMTRTTRKKRPQLARPVTPLPSAARLRRQPSQQLQRLAQAPQGRALLQARACRRGGVEGGQLRGGSLLPLLILRVVGLGGPKLLERGGSSPPPQPPQAPYVLASVRGRMRQTMRPTTTGSHPLRMTHPPSSGVRRQRVQGGRRRRSLQRLAGAGSCARSQRRSVEFKKSFFQCLSS